MSSCFLCTFLFQYFLNWLNLIDHACNTLLLGDANETISARTARARQAGRKWAIYACKLLSFGAEVITLGKISGDHCDYALNNKILPNSKEIWDWNTGNFLVHSITIIDDVELDS